jgi:zinc metalloprotease ZmpB
VIVRLIPGKDFAPADVEASADKTIHIYGYAGGMLVGGVSYALDPKLKPRKNGGGGQGAECNRVAQDLLDCVDLPRGRVREVHIRKICVDIELEDERSD